MTAPRADRRSRRPGSSALAFMIAAGITMVFAYGLRGIPSEGRLEMLWPAVGAAAGVAVRVGRAQFAAVIAGLAVTSLLVLASGGWPWPGVLVAAALVSAVATTIVALLRRWEVTTLHRPGDVGLLVAATGLAAIVSAPFAVVLAAVTGSPAAPAISGPGWVLGCLWGVVCVAPVILTIRSPRSWPLRRAPEFVVATAVTAVATHYNFFAVVPGRPGLLGWPYLVIVGLVWLAVRLGVAAVAPVVSLVAWFAAVTSAAGAGAFAVGASEPLGRLMVAQLFMVVVTLTVLLVAVLTDERIRAAAAMRDLAREDPVTGLPNRRGLQERLEGALAGLDRNPGVVGVLFCDLDQFKQVNDTLGHQSGDELLREVGKRLRGAARQVDTVARVGGDEFVVVCEGLDSPAEAVRAALRIQASVRFTWTGGHHTFRPTLSVGVATTASAHASPEELLRRADLAMYEAKSAGRDCVRAYEQSAAQDLEASVVMQQLLRTAVERDDLVLHYQPIVDLTDGTVTAAEALVRIRGSDGALVPPDQFIPLAESTGLINPIGEWVLSRAFTDLRDRGDGDARLSVSINVSPVQLHRAGFATWVLTEAERIGLDPRRVTIEVTETALIAEDRQVRAALRELHHAGVTIGLDDFGTGYSSLTWLTRFPVDLIKIDRSFVATLDADHRQTAIMAGVFEVSRQLEVAVIAEGVETEHQRERLIELGCPLGQGYLWGRPKAIGDGGLGAARVIVPPARTGTAPGSTPAGTA